MSLPRVASLETFAIAVNQRSRRSSDASTRGRKLSFNPLPETWNAPVLDQVNAVGAFEVPKWKRIGKHLRTARPHAPTILTALPVKSKSR